MMSAQNLKIIRPEGRDWIPLIGIVNFTVTKPRELRDSGYVGEIEHRFHPVYPMYQGLSYAGAVGGLLIGGAYAVDAIMKLV